jgi:hypothetical protein
MNELGASMLKSCAESKERRKLLRVQGSGCRVSRCGVFHLSSERLQPQPQGFRGQRMHPGSGCRRAQLGANGSLDCTEALIEKLFASGHPGCVVKKCQLWSESQPGLTEPVRLNQSETESDSRGWGLRTCASCSHE